MGIDNDQDDIVLGELDSMASSDEEMDAAATEEVDDSQLSEGDAMRRRSAQRRAERDRKKARRKELRSKNPESGKGRRIATIVIALLLCAALVAGGVYYFYFRGQNTTTRVAGNAPTANMDFGNITVVSASGTTSIGMSMETFDLNLSDVELKIEEVYVSNRDEVEKGQAILKISEDSIESARTTLQQAAKSAEYAYQLNAIDAQEDVIEAKDTYEQAKIALEYAEQDYADTISEAQAKITTLESQIEEQQELVDEYQAAVNDDDYYNKEYKVAELKAQLEKDQTLLQEIYDDTSNGVQEHLDYVKNGSYEAWKSGTQTTTTETATTENAAQATDQQGSGGQQGGMPSGTPPTSEDAFTEVPPEAQQSESVENEVYYDEAPVAITGTISAPGNASTSDSSSSSGSATISDEYESSSDTGNSLSTSSLTTSDLTTYPMYAAYVALDEEVTEEHEEYEAAVTKAERAQKRASSLLPQAQNKLESLQLQLRTAQNDLITTQEEAQETLDTARATAEAAEETYNTSIRNIENTSDTLKDAMDEADENLEEFEEQIGDGYLYTSNAGTIMMVNAEEGTTLSYNQVIVAYTDPGTISVTAAVDQSNIASITVGDTTAVVFEDAGIYQGFVSAINPVTQSSSRTSVTYSVTITLKGDVSAVSENISATIYFGDAVPLVFEQAGDQYHDPDADNADTDNADDTDETTDNEPAVVDTDMLLDNMMVNDDGTNYVEGQ